MTSILTGSNQESNLIITSDLSFTEAIVLPNHLILLSNPLKVKKIKYEAECEDGNIYELLNKSKNTSVFTTSFIFLLLLLLLSLLCLLLFLLHLLTLLPKKMNEQLKNLN